MTVTEVAFLRITPPHVWTSELVSDFILKLSQQQSACSGYPLIFLRRIQNASSSEADAADSPLSAESTLDFEEVVLVSGWHDLVAHNAWIASAENQRFLRTVEELQLLSVGLFMHLDVDFPALSDKLLADQPATVLYERMHDESRDGSTEEGLRWELRGRTEDEGKDEVWRFAGLERGRGVPEALKDGKKRFWLELTSI